MEIYRITHRASHTTYVGSAHNLKKRWGEHRAKLRGNYHENPHLQNAWDKYGEKTFEWMVLENNIEDESNLLDREQFWLDVYRMRGRVYNIALVTRCPMQGRKHTEETRCKISEGGKRRKHKSHTEETKQKLSALRAKSYPAFVQRETGEIISAGRNLKKLCEERGFCKRSMWYVQHGLVAQHEGWMLLDESKRKVNDYGAKPYPAFIHQETGEVILAGKNLSQLCKERGLGRSNMWAVSHGIATHHKGWVLFSG